MKNKTLAALTALVVFFSGLTGGFFLGRNTRVSAIQTSKTLYETVPGETVIVIQEVLVTLPPQATQPPRNPPGRAKPFPRSRRNPNPPSLQSRR